MPDIPTNDGFVALEHSLDTSSVDDEGFAESNLEDMEFVSDVGCNPTIDYWFGKLYLKCTVAKDILQALHPGESLEEVDFRVEKRLHTYPYTEVLEFLQAQGVATSVSDIPDRGSPSCQDESDRTTLLTLTGVIVRTGDRREQSTLSLGLRRLGENGTQSYARGHTDASTRARETVVPSQGQSSFNQQTSSERSTPLTEENAAPQDIPRYTMALKEHGDLLNVQPSYDVITKSQNPPWFRAVVSFRDLKEDGEARTKKSAKHIAAWKMCRSMDIRLL